PVNQQMALSAQFAPIGRVGTGLLASKRRWDHLAVSCLPLPGDTAHPVVPGEHHADNSLKQTGPGPLLEAPMHGRTGAVLLRNSIPVATGAQYKKNPVEHITEGHTRPSRCTFLLLLGQYITDAFPHG